ncbi:hypothetical protein D3C86_1800060 [compost metagenome]
MTTETTSGKPKRAFSTALACWLALSRLTLGKREAEITLEPSSMLGRNSVPRLGTSANEATSAPTAPKPTQRPRAIARFSDLP